MDYTKKTILITMLFFVVGVTVCHAKPAATSKESRAKALELLDKYAATADKAFTSFIFKSL